MRVFAVLMLAAGLVACAFSSEQPLFDDREAAAPFADGERFSWLENGDRNQRRVEYRRVGRGYEIASTDAGATPMGVTFFDVPDTQEDDYIAQVTLQPGEPGRVYAFMWRIEGGWRVVAAPGAFAAGASGKRLMASLCAARPNNECQFTRREHLLTFYREAVHAAFVAASGTPEAYIDQLSEQRGDEK